METKIIGVILLICAALIFQYSYDDFMDSFFSPGVKLKATIEKDISKSLSKETPENQSNIHHVKFVYRSTTALEFLKKHPPQFHTNKNGKVWLEVEVLDLQDNEEPSFITQISVFDVKSQNKISEFGETYHFKDFDKDFKVKVSDTPSSPEKPETEATDESTKKKALSPTPSEDKAKINATKKKSQIEK